MSKTTVDLKNLDLECTLCSSTRIITTWLDQPKDTVREVEPGKTYEIDGYCIGCKHMWSEYYKLPASSSE